MIVGGTTRRNTGENETGTRHKFDSLRRFVPNFRGVCAPLIDTDGDGRFTTV